MFDILFARTFFIVGAMLLITAGATYMNKNVSGKSGWGTIIMTFVLLFAIMMFEDVFPLNLLLVSLFSALIGWMISPTIKMMGEKFKINKYLKNNGIKLKKGEELNPIQLQNLEDYLSNHQSNEQWNKIISQAMFSTALAVFATASLVFMSDIDFSFMGMFLFVALLILIIMGLLNMFLFKSKIFSLVRAYFGVIIFTGYLIFDFNTLEKMAGDETWGTAVSIAVNIYLDIINLFMFLLEILGDS